MATRMFLAVLLAVGLAVLRLGTEGWSMLSWGDPGKALVAGPSPSPLETATAREAMAEFWIRAAVHQVPPPAGTGLPNVRQVVITPLRPTMFAVHLEVDGVDNPAWSDLPAEEKVQYARDVLHAVARAVPTQGPDAEHASMWIAVKVWDWFSVPKEMSHHELDDLACRRVVRTVARWECYGGVSASVSSEIPPPAVWPEAPFF